VLEIVKLTGAKLAKSDKPETVKKLDKARGELRRAAVTAGTSAAAAMLPETAECTSTAAPAMPVQARSHSLRLSGL
jgi:hypothetical protein